MRPADAGDEQHRERDRPRSTSPVPRSGCRKTSAAGTSPSSSRRAVRWPPSRASRGRSRSRRARAISSSFPSSEGWKVKKGSSIQRRDPRAAVPSTSTRTIRGDHRRVEADPQLAEARVVDAGDGEHQRDPDDGVDGLADHEEVGVALDEVLGGWRARGDQAGDQRNPGEGDRGPGARRVQVGLGAWCDGGGHAGIIQRP